LNGRISHKGWVLVWLPNATEPLPQDVYNIPKLSPGRLFAPTVRHALYVEENFSTTPDLYDLMFLSSEMNRRALNERTHTQKDENGKKQKFQLPAEPERHAVLLASAMRKKKAEDGTVSTKKISPYDAVKQMVMEVGGDPRESDPKPLKQQREFYERILSFVNRVDLRSPREPTHRYDIRHWIRSRWVLHDLHREEGRILRCDWYAEHVHWGNDLDQLSFAHVMARGDIERKFSRDEPDDHMRAQMPKHPELDGMTDADEWYALLKSDEGSKSLVQRKTEKIPDSNEEEVKEEELGADKGTREVGIYARIMSDKVMLLARNFWEDMQKRKIASAESK